MVLSAAVLFVPACNEADADNPGADNPGADDPEAGQGREEIGPYTTHLDEKIPGLMKKYGIPGVCAALIRDGEPVWSRAYGYADAAAGRLMNTDTRCRVESISKSVTAWGVMKLADEGRIDLDTPVVRYLKSWEFPASDFSHEKITVRQLLSGSAGMPLGTIGVHYAPGEAKPSLEDILSQDAVLQREPGEMFFYSNTGFNILELLIEEVTGRDFAEYMEKEVLKPLGMNDASFNWSSEWVPAVPNGYDLGGRPIPVYVYPDKAAGGLFATVEDIAAFAAAGLRNSFSAGVRGSAAVGMKDAAAGTGAAGIKGQTGQPVLSAAALEAMYMPAIPMSGYYSLVFDSYGFGHFIEELPNGMKAVSHGGQGSGWMTHFHIVPESGDGIVLLTNSQRSWPFIAAVLNDWAEWAGFGGIGMGLIVRALMVLQVLMALTAVLLAWQAVRLIRGMITGRRRFEPLAEESRLPRAVQGLIGVAVLGALRWALGQEYFFLNSVFPTVSVWLGWTLLGTAVVLLASAVLPLRSKIE